MELLRKGGETACKFEPVLKGGVGSLGDKCVACLAAGQYRGTRLNVMWLLFYGEKVSD
jgi:hypothetical protein